MNIPDQTEFHQDSYDQAILDVITTLKDVPAFQTISKLGMIRPERVRTKPNHLIKVFQDMLGKTPPFAKEGRFYSFQQRASQWVKDAFGLRLTIDTKERNDRFLEESLELVQSLKYTASEAHQMVDHVFSRTPGSARQEVGGVLHCLAVLCSGQALDMIGCAEQELDRVQPLKDKVADKHKTKIRFQPIYQIEPNSDAGRTLLVLNRWLAETPIYEGQDSRSVHYQQNRDALTFAIKAIEGSVKAGLTL